MKTENLISMLAAGVQPVEPNAAQRRFMTALGWGAFGVTLMMAIWLGVRRDIAVASWLPMFWVKLAFPGVLLGGALMALHSLSQPGARVGRAGYWIAGPVLVMWLLGALVLMGADPASRGRLVFGVSWTVCPFYIAALSIPGCVAIGWAMKGLAPTRLVAAGAVAGFAAGALGAMAYALYCPEMAAPFLGIWYLAGMLIPAAVGAIMGPWFFRW